MVRNAAHTAPYMHNGSLKTLKNVMDFYNTGGGNGWAWRPRIEHCLRTSEFIKRPGEEHDPFTAYSYS